MNTKPKHQGSETPDQPDVGAEEESAFALLPPGSWNVARDRTSVIREFLALEDRTAEIADEYAARLNVSRSRFYGLTKAFKDAEDGLLRQARSGLRRLDPALEQVVAGAIQACGLDAKLKTINAAVDALCKVLDLAPPSTSVIQLRISAARQAASTASRSERRIVLDEVDLGLAVPDASGRAVTPTFTALIDTDDGRIIGHALSLDDDVTDRARRTLADAFGAEAPHKDAHLSELVAAAVATAPNRRGSALSQLLGNRLGSIVLRPRKVRSAIRGNVSEIKLSVAQAAVRRLIDIHNSGRDPQGDLLLKLSDLLLADQPVRS